MGYIVAAICDVTALTLAPEDFSEFLSLWKAW